MFTGIIEELGTVERIERKAGGAQGLVISAELVSSDLSTGDSVSVNGACLTVVKTNKKEICFDVIEETLKHTNLLGLKAGDKVNLERALKVGDRFSGHFVSGHIDGTGEVLAGSGRNRGTFLKIGLFSDLLKFVVLKGSVAVDGVSLTVSEVGPDFLGVDLIPHTLKQTTLGLRKTGDKVNVEVDMLAKYAANFIQGSAKIITKDFLTEHGFL